MGRSLLLAQRWPFPAIFGSVRIVADGARDRGQDERDDVHAASKRVPKLPKQARRVSRAPPFPRHDAWMHSANRIRSYSERAATERTSHHPREEAAPEIVASPVSNPSLFEGVVLTQMWRPTAWMSHVQSRPAFCLPFQS
ncbi:hypothetical protein HETIRDRAFT_106079 [Heterobasidion irregulare TC 32-1]|uniref:Uncharacterized protein n=1 Tax=Heterobasidion irregulare (strain TC 32-1) TaxID=747525 RepID=W4JSX6_HETIT|nr:uncharacterized protein HETIRDRAFT_106079 [Heterobasidion irregulare TC 32-1]ETW76643.1 hypothetical protein HETIRDRAFT_106079 [Heterobasidion irregulare TC 32-1]